MIKNLYSIRQMLNKDKDLLESVIQSYENEINGSTDNVILYDVDETRVQRYRCKSERYILHAGDVVDYVARQEDCSDGEAIKKIVANFNLPIKIETDQTYLAFENYFKAQKREPHIEEHHYYYTDAYENILCCKVMLTDTIDKTKETAWYVVHKFEKEDGTVVIEPKLYDGEEFKMPNVLYHAHMITENTKTLVFTGSEKDADTVHRLLGLPTTCTQSSGSWCDGYTEQIKHIEHFIIFGDNDDTGRAAVENIVKNLKEITGEVSTERSIKVVHMPIDQSKANITDYVEMLKGQGYSVNKIRADICNLIECAEDVISPYELHSDRQGLYKFVADKKNGYKKQHVTDYTIEVLERIRDIESDRDNKIKIRITPCNSSSNEPFIRMIYGDSFNTTYRYNKMISNSEVIPVRSRQDLYLIQDYVIQMACPIKNTVSSYGGIRKIDGELYFVEKNRCLNAKGFVSDKYTYVGDGIETNLLNYEPITSDELKELTKHLFKFNTPYIATGIIGYCVASFFKEHLDAKHVSFPNLQVMGETKSGKTETIDYIVRSIFGYIQEPINVNDGLTNSTRTMLLSSNNIIPLLFDNYKFQKRRSQKVKNIECAFSYTYDRSGIYKTNKDLSITCIKIITNIVLTGEIGLYEAWATGRSFICYFNKRDSEKYKREYLWLKENRTLLSKLGRLIAEKALNISPEEVKRKYDAVKNTLDKNLAHSRMGNTVCCLMVGLEILNEIEPCVDLVKAQEILVEAMHRNY